MSQCKDLDKNKFPFSPPGLLAYDASVQTLASAPPRSIPGDYGSHLELLELALQLKEVFMQSWHSSLVSLFLDGEVGATGLLSVQDCLKGKYIKATVLKPGSCPFEKAQDVPSWDGEGSDNFM